MEELNAVKQSVAKLERASGVPKATGFSSVPSGTADELLESRKIDLLDGRVEDPIEVPGSVVCEPFDYSPFRNEKEGTPALMRHHEEQLKRCGVQFGRGGYTMYDLQRYVTCFHFASKGGQVYNGTTDCCVAPSGLWEGGAAPHLRVGFEHKYPFEKPRDAGGGLGSSSTVRFSFYLIVARDL